MAWSDLWVALALVMVIEGLLPFLSPQGFKDSMRRVLGVPDSTLRAMGLGSMIIGLILIYWVR